MTDEQKQLEHERQQFFNEVFKVKLLIETGGATKKLRDKVGFLKSMRRILGL